MIWICYYQVRPIFEDLPRTDSCPIHGGWQVIRVLAEKGLEVQKTNDRGDCPLICATWSSEIKLSN